MQQAAGRASPICRSAKRASCGPQPAAQIWPRERSASHAPADPTPIGGAPQIGSPQNTFYAPPAVAERNVNRIWLLQMSRRLTPVLARRTSSLEVAAPSWRFCVTSVNARAPTNSASALIAGCCEHCKRRNRKLESARPNWAGQIGMALRELLAGRGARGDARGPVARNPLLSAASRDAAEQRAGRRCPPTSDSHGAAHPICVWRPCPIRFAFRVSHVALSAPLSPGCFRRPPARPPASRGHSSSRAR